MSNFQYVNLFHQNGKNIRVNTEYLNIYKQELLDFLDGQDYMKTLTFAQDTMMSQEIKSNNNIEGINDDLDVINDTIHRKNRQFSKENKRITNLYLGYKYILKHKLINKDSLKKLYSILSNDILDSYDLINMGEYYRTKPVYILKGRNLDNNFFMGMDEDKLDYYMNQFFMYVNDDSNINSEIDIFIKSQIMHFYFVYIHPYFDVNGRTSRTLAMWYLLNHEVYPYIIFNRAIVFSRREYEDNIIKARSYGDVTLFLKYMLVNVERELEKEYLIHSIKDKTKYQLTNADKQMLEYFINIKGNLTVKDLITIYNNYNDYKKIGDIYEEKILPLIEKEIIIKKGCTKGFIKSDTPNINICLNSKLVDVNPEKVKHLNLEKYIG